MHERARPPVRQRGFTLIELVVVILVAGILASTTALGVARLVDGYLRLQRRVVLSDNADLALRRIARDVQAALPMSLRVASLGQVRYLELLATKTGGRFVYQPACFTASGCQSLTTIGAVQDGSWAFIAGSDRLSLWSQDYGTALNCAGGDVSAWCADTPGVVNWAPVITSFDSVGVAQQLRFANTAFSAVSDQAKNAFRVIEGPVTWVCDPVAGTLTRYWAYGLPRQTQWTGTPPADARSALMAQQVSGCELGYDSDASAELGLQGRGLLSLALTLSAATESVSLMHQIHVNNVP
ncbi:type II secretion system protein [Curvibacter sp. HBC61]|uniref:Type II secretion system protein n=1 Tax=Curvibacter cyanobacteriorum TaxID=3026422 RepID=A0ABT5N6K5_9BURK|nr:type II secretion system protein [Curvibacter sp. HBC61]MDD0840757.1 type II secretion system protein [Curvibacter sp. HBC61]